MNDNILNFYQIVFEFKNGEIKSKSFSKQEKERYLGCEINKPYMNGDKAYIILLDSATEEEKHEAYCLLKKEFEKHLTLRYKDKEDVIVYISLTFDHNNEIKTEFIRTKCKYERTEKENKKHYHVYYSKRTIFWIYDNEADNISVKNNTISIMLLNPSDEDINNKLDIAKRLYCEELLNRIDKLKEYKLEKK